MTSSPTQAREIALQCLYQLDLRGAGAEPSVRALMDAASGPVRALAQRLVDGVRAEDAELTRRLTVLVEHWSWDRVAAVDRAILRIGAWELLHAGDVPPKVVIDEAIELAKRYSTGESGAFVNGILDRIYQERRTAAS